MKSIESIFSEALNQADLEERGAYIEEACQGDSDLKQQVLELIQAHEQAEGLLEKTRQNKLQPIAGFISSEHEVGNSAANYAREFLKRLASGAIADIDPYVDSIPKSAREETRQRIDSFELSATVIEHCESLPSPTPTMPKRISGFRIDRILGQGAIGTVYLAYDEKLRREVALKILHQKGNATLRKRILREAQRAASLQDPAIVTIYSVHDDESWPAIIMESVEGFPIDRAASGLTFPQKARILKEVARALSVAHRQGVIHRDLKPENVVVTPELCPKILDFGLAVSSDEGAIRRQFFEGTPRYASPEQVAGKSLTSASDIFSFGSLMFTVLTGKPPFDGSNLKEVLQAICTSEPPFLKDVSVGVPEDLQAICLACLAWNPEERPSAEEIALDLGRFLAGEPVRLRPALYGDILRRRITECSNELVHWEQQGMISSDEKDRLQTIHRRILADEDHWIVDARQISIAQTILYTGTWLVVLAAAFFVWLIRTDLSPPVTWLAPLAGTVWLMGAGFLSSRRREPLASASFLAGAILSIVPTSLALMLELGILTFQPESVTQLFTGTFTNTQVLTACVIALGLSSLSWVRLRMTGFAWTTAILITFSYGSWLLCLNWLGRQPDVMALWCLPLVSLTAAGLWAERMGRVRWALPFHLIAFCSLLVSLDLMAAQGPTAAMLGIGAEQFPFFNFERQRFLSLAANGYLFLILMLVTERASSLDLRRASRVLEPLALIHILGALYANAQAQRENPSVMVDVGLYAASVLLLLFLGPWRSRWRILIGALGGLALGSYLLIDLNLVGRISFTFSLAVVGFIASLATYVYLRIAPRSK